MTQAGRLSSSFGVPVVALKENMASLKSSAKAEGLDLESFSVGDNLTNAVDELSAFLEQASLGHFARAVPPYPPPPGYPPTASYSHAPPPSISVPCYATPSYAPPPSSHTLTVPPPPVGAARAQPVAPPADSSAQLHSGALVEGGEEGTGNHKAGGKN